MSNRMGMIIKNFSYTIIANLISVLISIVLILIVPKLVGVQEYGYWQLYLLYATYVVLLNFGWPDGINLRYGGKDYKTLDKNLLFSQFASLAIVQIIIGTALMFLAPKISSDVNQTFIFYMLAGYLLIINLRHMLLNILQATNRMKEYAQVIIMDRILYFLIIVLFLILGEHNYEMLIIVDVFCKLLSLIYAMYHCKEIVFRKSFSFSISFVETLENIKSGIKLMFAVVASTLIIGTVRFGIEHKWSVETFGKISLALSISNLLMTFINSVGIALFPLLKRTNPKNLNNIYEALRTLLMFGLLGMLILYYPLSSILSSWLPQYHETFVYMILIFPICIYEGKIFLLVNNYLKVIRREKILMYVNTFIMLLSIIVTFVTVFIFQNINLAVLSIVFLIALRCIISEVKLSKILKIKVYKDIFLEVSMTCVFIVSAWFSASLHSFIIYFVSFLIYSIFKKKSILKSIIAIKTILMK